MSAQSTPSEVELEELIRKAKIDHPQFGLTKLHTQIRTDHPQFLVSEKRFRKVHASIFPAAPGTPTAVHVLDGPLLAQASTSATPTATPVPKPTAGSGLDVQTGFDPYWTPSRLPEKVKAKMIPGAGKGLVTRTQVLQGGFLWDEHPWITSPDP
jgi:hypothetical protein